MNQNLNQETPKEGLVGGKMAMRLSANLGFITNSSSAVYHFPRALFEDPQVQAFIKAYGIDNGFVGSELWHRGECDTFAVTREQKEAVAYELIHGSEYSSHPGINVDNDDVVVIYGDEYSGLTQELASLFKKVGQKQGLTFYSDEYN